MNDSRADELSDLNDDTELPVSRGANLRGARTVFWRTLGLNVLVSAGKLICGFTTNTLSMVADGFHSLLDASSNVIGIVGLTISMKPPDEGHPYGHRKFEAIAAIVISFMMFLACFNILSGIFERIALSKPTVPSVGAVSYAVMAVTVLINILVTTYEKRKAAELKSKLLAADAAHTLSDIFVSLGVVVALIAAQFHFYIIDLLASLVIVAFIFKAGFGIIMSNLGTLVDAAVLDPEFIERIVLSVPGVISCHKIRSRGMQDHIFLDLHVQVPGHLTVEEGHQIAFAVESKIKKQADGVIDVVVHIEEAHA
jgi:cation diffusion facilitator family transporter